MRITRRNTIRSAGAALAAAALPRQVFAQTASPYKGTGEIVVASLGGSFEAAQRQGVFEPFAKISGIQVRTVAYQGPSQVVAQEKTGNVEWDAILMSKGALLSLVKQNCVAKIDYDRIPKQVLAGVTPQSLLDPHGVPNILFSRGIAYNTKMLSRDHHPRTWAEVWDVQKFPGPRSLGAYSGSLTPDLEFALLADGVPMDKLYPLDIDRAFKSLDRIRPHVAKFWESGAMSPQMLVDGDISVGSAYLNRIGDMLSSGNVPVDFDWGQGELQNNYWCILNNAKNYDNAMKFIAFSTSAEAQAGFSRYTLMGPVNVDAFKLLPPDRSHQLPTAPENLSKQFVYNDEWWTDNRDAVRQRWNEWAMKG